MHIERFVCCLPRTEGGNELEIITGAAVAVMLGDMPSYRLRELFRNISSCSERSIVDEEKKKKEKKRRTSRSIIMEDPGWSLMRNSARGRCDLPGGQSRSYIVTATPHSLF